MLYLVIRWIRLLGFTRYTTSELRSSAMLGPHTSYLTSHSDLGLYLRCRLDSHLVSVFLFCPSFQGFSVSACFTPFSEPVRALQHQFCNRLAVAFFFFPPPIMSEKYAQDKPRRVNTQARATH